jgi:hypothetical protein
VLLVAAFSIYFVTIFGTFYDQPHCWVPTVKLSLYFYNPINYLKSIQLAIVWPESFVLVPKLADNYKLTLLLILAEIIANTTLVPVLVCCTKARHWQCLLRIRLLCFPCCCKRDIITPVSLALATLETRQDTNTYGHDTYDFRNAIFMLLTSTPQFP